MYFWTSEVENKIEKYYELVLYSIKYILGFSEEGMRLANNFVKSDNQ